MLICGTACTIGAAMTPYRLAMYHLGHWTPRHGDVLVSEEDLDGTIWYSPSPFGRSRSGLIHYTCAYRVVGWTKLPWHIRKRHEHMCAEERRDAELIFVRRMTGKTIAAVLNYPEIFLPYEVFHGLNE